MASVYEYLDKISTERLEGILHSYCDGSYDLIADAALAICDILARRAGKEQDARKAFTALCRMYLS